MTTPAEPTEAPLSATALHYLEAIYYIAHEEEVPRPGRLAEWLGVSHPTVTVTLQRLERAGWLSLRADHSIALSPSGEAAAAAVVRRHRLLERWLVESLGFDWAAADQEAETLAITTSEAVIDRLDAALGQPTSCPHGNPIPGRNEVPAGTVRLDTLSDGESATVVRISEVAEHEAPTLLMELHQLGLFPGRAVVVRSLGSEIGLEVDGKAVEVNPQTAHAVWVDQGLG